MNTAVRQCGDMAASIGATSKKSQIVREAVQEYFSSMDRVSDSERDSMLRAFDELAPQIQARGRAEVDRELRAARRSRKAGGTRG